MKLRLNFRGALSPLRMLIVATLLFIAGQFAFFIAHGQSASLIDSLVKSSLSFQLIKPVIMVPILTFLLIQFLAYTLLIRAIWFVANSAAELLNCSQTGKYLFCLLTALLTFTAILGLNSYYFPHSFFAIPATLYNTIGMWIVFSLLAVLITMAYINSVWHKRYIKSAGLFFFLILSMLILDYYNNRPLNAPANAGNPNQPNIIFIGLDSVRPDYTSYAGNHAIHTPNTDDFLKTGTIFTENYTALARTFPSWVSILTGKYPLHTGARNNLAEANAIIAGDTLPKELQKAGYETIYATDEKRFSNITKAFGFDRIIGPAMGVNDFLIGGLTDLPLTNLLINLPVGKYLFPYNFGNRAAAITYTPNTFLQLVKSGLAQRSNKPLFLTVHLCLAHWPYFYGRDGQPDNLTVSTFYRNGVQNVDTQLGSILTTLKEDGLLQNSIVILLSDHGTTMGLWGDRSIEENYYRGELKKIHLMTTSKLSETPAKNADPQDDYSLSTVYGQGTDVLSLKQHHTLLAMKGYGVNIPVQTIKQRSAMIDIAPTILDILQLPPLKHIDGVSLKPVITHNTNKKAANRPFYFETGDKIGEIETDKISVAKVVQKRINSYQIDLTNGLLVLNPIAEKALVRNKQRAIIWNNWLLAKYPSEKRQRLIPDPAQKLKKMKMHVYRVKAYYVLVNLKTKEWTIGLDTPFAKKAPVKTLLAKLKDFYGDEL